MGPYRTSGKVQSDAPVEDFPVGAYILAVLVVGVLLFLPFTWTSP